MKREFALMIGCLAVLALPASASAAVQSGVVMSGTTPLAFAAVTLYKAGKTPGTASVLGRARSHAGGFFRIFYRRPRNRHAVLYLVARAAVDSHRNRGFRSQHGAVRLAAVLGPARLAGYAVINERTTVATAYAMAQFISGSRIGGKSPGLQNAAIMAQNLADVATGAMGSVLARPPNGPETSTMPEFNSLANLLAACVDDGAGYSCSQLFRLARPPRGPTPKDTLQAISDIAHNPAQNVLQLFVLSQDANLYEPSLGPSSTLDAWTLAIRFGGDRSLFDGPGNIAFDRHGNAWVNNNYARKADPKLVCGDDHVFKLTPGGAEFPGSPFGGLGSNGGLYGSGFGIAVAPGGDTWVSNFGFQGSQCQVGPDEQALLSQSVSQFRSDGTALSPSRPPFPFGGWRSYQANMSQPQGTVSDQWGNIWIANCGNGSVTKFPRGSLARAENFADIGVFKPFGLAIGPKGHVWVSSNGNNKVVELSQAGSVIAEITGGGLNLPMGIATDRRGDVWVANSGAVRPPCAGTLDSQRLSADDAAVELPPAGASVTLRRPNGKLQTFTGGGIFIPWGIAVDGSGNVWVANFGGPRSGLVGITELCGANPAACPPGDKTGDAISPKTGYTSNGLVRLTGIAIDPSGNVWLANNWLIDALRHQENPGGHEVVVFIGLAAPVAAPLLGPPQRP